MFSPGMGLNAYFAYQVRDVTLVIHIYFYANTKFHLSRLSAATVLVPSPIELPSPPSSSKASYSFSWL